MPSSPHRVALFDDYWAPSLAFAGSLGRRGVALDIYGTGALRHSKFRTRQASCPPVSDADVFLPWLRERVLSGEIRRVAPTTDLIAYYVAVLREHFPPDVQRSIQPLGEIETALLKTRFAAACARAGHPVPHMAAPDDPDEAIAAARRIGYPLFLKPKSHLVVGSADRGQIVRNEAELQRAYRPYPVAAGQSGLAQRYPELRWPLIQRYLPSARRRVYSVSGIKDADAGLLAATVSCKRAQWPPDIGVSILQESCSDERILAKGVAIIESLVSRGIFELELLVEGTELLAIDLNPRAFGFIRLDIARGADLPWLWFESTQRVVRPTEVARPTDDIECRFVVPYYIARGVSWLFGGGTFPRARAASPRHRWISMLGDRSDPLPMLLSHARLLKHPRSLVRPYVQSARESLPCVVEAVADPPRR